VLYNGGLEVVTPRRSVGRRLRGSIALQWLPTPRVEAHFVLPNPKPQDLHGAIDLGFTVRPLAPRPSPQRPRYDLTPRSRAKSRQTMHGSCDLATPEFGDGSALTEIRFHVANFPLVHGRSIAYDTHLAHARLAFSWNGWSLMMDQVPMASEAEQDLHASGGYRLTHTGSLTRAGGEEFSADAAQRVMEAFGYLLMFACGANCGPLLPVGFGGAGDPAWAYWRTPGVQPWRSRFMWLDKVAGAAQLEALFPVFMEKWSDPLTEGVLRRVLHYYVASNTPPSVDASMVLAFVALEILERLTLPGIRGDADSRLRQMLKQHHVPTEVPRGLRHLLQAKNANYWNDAPKTLAEMRHRIVHPELQLPDLPVDARVQGWLLVTWYIELLLLAVLGYEGRTGTG